MLICYRIIIMSHWKPSATIQFLQQRNQYIRKIREYFYNAKVLEVETPILSQFATVDPNIESFTTDFNNTSTPYYLRTSPEFAMKRLLASGSGDIYSIAKVFRNEQHGRLHNPEFSMLEWYRIKFTLNDLMDEVTKLLTSLSTEFNEVARYSYAEVFQKYLAINPHIVETSKLLIITRNNINITSNLTRADCLDLLFNHIIQPKLIVDNTQLHGYYIHSYPQQMADLAQISFCKQSNALVANRFELFINGIEIANGYYELLDAIEQQQRFIKAQQQRKSSNKHPVPYDKNLIDALKAGMPCCSGVALGLDRVFMMLQNKDAIADVMPFDFNRC